MNFNELKTKIEAGQLNLAENIEVKKYLPLVQKKLFADSVIDVCILEDNGVKKIDYLLKVMQTDFNTILNYTDIDLDNIEDSLDFYDFLKENGIIDYVLEQIPEAEKCQLFDLIELEISQKFKTDNSPIIIFAKSFNELVEKLPKVTDKQLIKLVKDLAKSNPQLLESFNALIKQSTNQK